jgi:hypothetical protein
MKKKVIRLTEEEFYNHIEQIVTEALNELGGKMHAQLYNASTQARRLNQAGNYTKVIYQKDEQGNIIKPLKNVNNDRTITKAGLLEPDANALLLKPFIDATYLFYATTRTGRSTFLTFKVTGIKKLMNNIAILSGNVTYDGYQMNGDIMIDFAQNRIFYTERKSRYKYTLEPDNRTINIWNKLTKQLKLSLDNRI